MTKYSFARKSLRNGVLFGAPLALSIQCDPPDEDYTHVSELTVHIEPTGQFVEALNNCLADRDACIEVCDLVLVDRGITGPDVADIYECRVTKQASSVEVYIQYSYPIGVGCGVVMVQPDSEPTSIGSHYAAMAELEASSVYAFVQLARDLRHHGAPGELVRAAVRAAEDEVRHTRQASMLARAWAGTPRPIPRQQHPDRDLFTLCLENTVDGCVHETFGAAVANHQAMTAADPFIRSTMQTIARDEMRHAALAEAIDRWFRPQLSKLERRALETAARYSAHMLAASQRDAPEMVSELAGFPSAEQARSMIRSLEAKRRARWS